MRTGPPSLGNEFVDHPPNPPTIVIVLQPVADGLVMIRRALKGEGFGKLAIPGGYQIVGQTWQEAGADELQQETGVVVDPADLRFVDIKTTPDKTKNLLFCEAPPLTQTPTFTHDHEVSEVVVITKPVETAFPLHTEQVRDFFIRKVAF